MRLVIAHLALRASLAIYHLISNAHYVIIVKWPNERVKEGRSDQVKSLHQYNLEKIFSKLKSTVVPFTDVTAKISGQVSNPAMVFVYSIRFNLMIKLLLVQHLSFPVGSYTRESIEKYTFIVVLIPNCTINGHSSWTGKTSKSPRYLLPRFNARKSPKQHPIPNLCFKGYL